MPRSNEHSTSSNEKKRTETRGFDKDDPVKSLQAIIEDCERRIAYPVLKNTREIERTKEVTSIFLAYCRRGLKQYEAEALRRRHDLR